LRVRALRAAGVPALGLVPADPAPLRLDPADPWDAHWLGRAFDLTEQLEAGSAGFSAQATVLDATSLRGLVPGMPSDPPARLLTRRPGDQLVGAAIASVASTNGSFGPHLDAALDFYDDGAPWGLVVLDQLTANEDDVVALVRAAITLWASRSGGLGAAVVALPSRIAAPTPVTGAPSTPSGAATPGLTSPPTTTAAPPPTTAPPVTIPPAVEPLVPATLPPIEPPPSTGTPVDDVLSVIKSVVTAVVPLLAHGS
jgi:hypothetical protein